MCREAVLPSFSLLQLLCMMWMRGAEGLCLGVASCGCEANPSGFVVNCRDQNLDNVPAFVPDNVDQVYYELTLDSNAIRTIESNAFAGIRTRRLVLTNNRISQVADDAFSGLERDLIELMLQIDPSMAFPAVALSKLTMMKTLEIIGYGEEALPPDALTPLANLRSLALTSGALRRLTPQDFNTQKSQLTFLNLYSNLFQEVPTSAISVLTNLSVLQLDLNRLSAIGSGAFDGASNLAILNLARNPVTEVELDAFSGLENTLRNLSLQQCHLSSEHLKAIVQLKSLVYLDISDNYFVDIDDILTSMKFLEVLKASRNRITSLKRAAYRSVANSLLILYLDDNPSLDVASDTFSDLTLLQELYLDGAQRLVLDERSFTSQERSLKLLSMRSTNLSSPWSAVSMLGALKTLWMSSCELTEVPDATFSGMSGLENLDLNNNAISRLTQRSLFGLSTSLIRLYLSGNKLRTLDECLFYEFQKLDILQLQLNNNPLECNCALKWLHDSLGPYKSNPATQFRVMSLQWKCANLNSRLFTSLTDTDFSDCPSSANRSVECEHLEYVPAFSASTSAHLVPTVTEDSISVTPAESNVVAVIIGTSLAGVFVVVCVVTVVIVVCIQRRQQQQQQQLKPSTQLMRSPTVGRQSKRYRKTKDIGETALTVEGCSEDPGDALVHTLVAMTDEEKDRLVNLLTSSMSGSVDDLDQTRASSYRYVGARYGRIDAAAVDSPYSLARSISIRDRHEYDEIPDSYYDEIKCESETADAEETLQQGEATSGEETRAINRSCE